MATIGKQPDRPLFVSAKTLTETYGIPESTVRSWIYRRRSDGRPVSPVPFSRVGRGAVVFNRVQLEAFIERQMQGGDKALAFPRRLGLPARRRA
jgi:hypothetical protein